MNSKRSISLSTVAFAVVVLVIASGAILGIQGALAANWYGSGLGLGGYCGQCGYGFYKHFYPYFGGYGFRQHVDPYDGGYPFELPFP
jgi:hypothetical protein